MKRWFLCLLAILMFLPVFGVTAQAADVPEFYYELTVDGKDTVEVNAGDVITVTLHLLRTDEETAYTMYAMQDEIRYDSEFFKLVENSSLLSNGIQSTDISVLGGFHEFYMNFVSFSGGVQWQPKTRIGSFQLEVIGDAGVSTITNEDFLVSLPDGSGSYKCKSNVLTVILTADCTVRFETNGGTPIAPVTAIYGELLPRPEDPVREGKYFAGWFKDIHLTEEWDFATDAVKGNMTLYAKWSDTPVNVPSDNHCIICDRSDMLIPGVPLCWICLLILVLILLAVVVAVYLIRRHKKAKKKKTKGKYQR